MKSICSRMTDSSVQMDSMKTSDMGGMPQRSLCALIFSCSSARRFMVTLEASKIAISDPSSDSHFRSSSKASRET